jgi:RNA polymerase sigma-70 factor (ECF subfamily)
MARPAWVTRVLDAGRHAWPQLAVDGDALAAFLVARCHEGSVQHPADLHLAFACSHGDRHALARFDALVREQLPGWIARIGREPDFVAEVRQALGERVFVGARPRIAEYLGQGPLGGWLRVVATRIALNLRRSAAIRGRAEARGGDGDVALARSMDARLMQRHLPAVQAALRAALGRLAPEQRYLLRVHYVEHVRIDSLARAHRVDPSTMSRRLTSARCQLLEDVKRELTGKLRLGNESLDGIIMDVRSELHLSLSALA